MLFHCYYIIFGITKHQVKLSDKHTIVQVVGFARKLDQIFCSPYMVHIRYAAEYLLETAKLRISNEY